MRPGRLARKKKIFGIFFWAGYKNSHGAVVSVLIIYRFVIEPFSFFLCPK